jgi:hypothetical protein
VLEFLGFSEQNRNPPSRRTARRGKRNLKDFSLICFVECEDYWEDRTSGLGSAERKEHYLTSPFHRFDVDMAIWQSCNTFTGLWRGSPHFSDGSRGNRIAVALPIYPILPPFFHPSLPRSSLLLPTNPTPTHQPTQLIHPPIHSLPSHFLMFSIQSLQTLKPSCS